MRINHIVIFAMAICIWSFAESGFSESIHNHTHHSHDTSGLELGVSAGYVHLEEEDEDALGIHSHLLKRLGDEGIRRHLAIGLGAEYLFSDEEHYAAMLSLAVYPWRGLVLSVSPGVQWAEHEGDVEAEYSTHIEAAYVFPFGKYDIGPVIDYSWTNDEEHYMIGLHFGIHL